jgi:uncharacterized protein
MAHPVLHTTLERLRQLVAPMMWAVGQRLEGARTLARLELLTRVAEMNGPLERRIAFEPRETLDGLNGEEPPLEGEVYRRRGSCNGCGKCCESILLGADGQLIQTVEEFEALKQDHPQYAWFYPAEIRELGILFRCHNLGEDKRCMDYDHRPDFCRRYPNEDTILMGGCPPPECGYWFEPAKTFQQVLSKHLP